MRKSLRTSYNPADYWEARLSANFSLQGVGHISYSAWYNRWLYQRKRACLEEFFGSQNLAGRAVLDIGSGTGFFINWYSRRQAVLTGVDITEISIRELRRRFSGNFQVCDISAESVHFEKLFDIVNMWDVVYHITDDAHFYQAMANVAAACRPGGYFLLTDRFASTLATHLEAHVRWRGLAVYQKFMPDLGFRLVELRPLFNWLNRSVVGRPIDNIISPLYYWLDTMSPRIAPSNLCLAVWQRVDQG